MIRTTVGRPLALSALLGAAIGFAVLVAGCSSYGPSEAAVDEMRSVPRHEFVVIATVDGEGPLERLELLAPEGALRPGDPDDEPPYVWQGAPLRLRPVFASGQGGDLIVDWVADDGRVLESTRLSTGRLGGPLDRLGSSPPDLMAGGYRIHVRLFPEDSLGRTGIVGPDPIAERSLEFAIGAPEQATIDPPAPPFPWPPPRPATRHALTGDRFGSPETLGDAADRLLAALDAAGYAEHSFFSVQPDPTVAPEGFALVTRLEQIEPDGRPRPGAERWSVKLPEREIFSLGDFVRALFSAPEGHYRVIVFTVTGRSVAPSDEAPSRGDAGEWLGTGLARLPPALADLPWTRDHAVTALIYQFRQVGTGTEPEVNPPNAPPARDQLERTGILAGLGE